MTILDFPAEFISKLGIKLREYFLRIGDRNVIKIYRKVNRTSEAMSMLERCVAIDSSYTPAYLLMAKLHALDGRKKMVGQLLRHVVEMHPKNPDHLAEYAGWLYDQGEKNQFRAKVIRTIFRQMKIYNEPTSFRFRT